jgi:pyruvate kinase
MGPACKGSVLPRLVAAGMNVARLNFAHGTREEHGAWIRHIRELSERQQTPVAILQDLAGPKVRSGEVPDGEMNLEAGDEFFLVAGSAGRRPRSSCSKYNAKGGMRFAFPPYGLWKGVVGDSTVLLDSVILLVGI